MKRLLLSILCCYSLSLCAQNTLSGLVVAKSDHAPIEMATVRLFSYTESAQVKDSVLVQGAQTAYDGMFVLNNIPQGDYRLIISSVGYADYVQEVKMPNHHLDLPHIRLLEQVQHLSEVNVQGKAAEMTVKGDTIEYNTAAYQVGETATVEELLKKMNGVEVDKEGKVTINGEEIKAVRVDGKKFFGNDVQTATKNIPAEMIDKIQVIDEKSDMAKLTGFEDDETERIINLSLKKNRKQGLFGNYSGALGADLVADNGKWFGYDKQFLSNDFRYGANIFTNLLLGESQTTIVGSANNTNEIRSGRGRGAFGGQNAGITASENVGVNTNLDLTGKLDKKDSKTQLLFGGDASFNHSHNDTRTLSNKESYSEEATYIDHDSTMKMSQSWDAQMRLEMEYQIDSMNKIILRPQISYTHSTSAQENDYTFDRDSVRINDGYQHKNSLQENINAAIRSTYNHKFAKKGRSLTLQANVNFTNTQGTTDTYAWDRITQSALVDQYTLSGNNALSYSLRASYVEPLGKASRTHTSDKEQDNAHFLEMAIGVSGNNRYSVKDQFSMDSLTGDYRYDSVYSNTLSNHMYTEQLEVNYRWLNEKIDLTAGARVLATQTHSETYYGGLLARDTLYNRWNWSPNLSFRYKFGRKEFARIVYRGTVNQPSIQQMEPVRNNSDAMNETVGNLGLQPAFNHNLFAMYSRFNQEKFSSFMTGLHANLTQDALVNNTIYDQIGKRYMQTVNADMLPWNVGWDMMSNTPFHKKMFQFHSRTAISYNQRVAYVLREQNAEDIAQLIAANQLPLGDASKTGNFRMSSDLALRFTHPIVDIGVKNTNVYSLTHNSLNKKNISHIGDWIVTGDVTFHLPQSWNIATDISYTSRHGYAGLSDVNEVVWNVSIDKSWKNATLSLKVYDLLHDKKNIVQTVSENSVSYQKFNTLPTYAMLTFTYKLNRMGSLKAKGAAGFMQDMIEGQAPGGRRGGPPPPMPPM